MFLKSWLHEKRRTHRRRKERKSIYKTEGKEVVEEEGGEE